MAKKEVDKAVNFDDPVAQCIWNYKEEAKTARVNRAQKNRENWECYHMRQDWGHKKRGQSKEFLAKQTMAVEQITAFLQQGLMDTGEWFRVTAAPGVQNPKILPDEIKELVYQQISKNDFPYFLSDTLKTGLLASLMIVKVGGKKVKKSVFEARGADLSGDKKLIRKDKQVWQLDLKLVRHEDYFPDPTGKKLYEIQRIELDYWELLEMAEEHPGYFDMEKVRNVQASDEEMQKTKKARETDQNIRQSGYRKLVTIYECWGKFIEPNTGKVLHDNSVAVMSEQGDILMPPRENPLWHGGSPFNVSSIIRVPHSVHHKALMDAATRHNLAENELYNLMLDASMGSVFGIRQIKTGYLEDPEQVANGLYPGMTLLVNSSCPPGEKVLERVDTSALSPDAMNLLNITDREFQQSALTNDTRLGSLPQRAVKATEVVASNQSITGVFNGIVKMIEECFLAPLLEKCWLTMAQNMDDLDSDETKALIGEDRALILSQMTAEERFANSALGHQYQVFGLSTTLNKIQDFRKITTLLQSIGGSPQMMQEFMRKYSMTKLLGEIIKSLDIDESKIEADPEEQAQRAQEMQQQQQAAIAQAQAENGQTPPQGSGQPAPTQGGQGTNPQSQIPQASSSSQSDGGIEIPRGVNNIGMTHPG